MDKLIGLLCHMLSLHSLSADLTNVILILTFNLILTLHDLVWPIYLAVAEESEGMFY